MAAPPTMRQVAERAGVNRSTVSLALRNDPRLKRETREKIQSLAKEMGYQQNPTVAHLMTQLRAGQQKHFRSNIAFLDFGPLGAIEHQIWLGAQQRAKMLGYGLEFFHVRDFAPQRLEQILVNRGIQGLIISPLWGFTTLPLEFNHLWATFSCCCVGIHPNNPELHFVGDDNFSTARTAVEKLAQMGFSRIGLAIHSGINVETEYRFVGGYVTAHVADPKLDQLPILYLGVTDRNEFLSWFRRVKPQVVICIQEEILAWLIEAGYKVPEDVSLIHLDLAVVSGSWAGMRQDRTLRGRIAIDVVVAQINHNEIGIPASQIATLAESTWEPGPTLAIPENGKTPNSPVSQARKQRKSKPRT